MNSEKESFEDFKKGLLADLDALELVPETLWTIIRPTLYFSLPGAAGAILGYWLMIKDEANVGEYLLLVLGVFFLACGIMFFFVGLIQFPRERTRYSFTNQGFTIKYPDGNMKLVTWKEMDSLKIEGEKQGYAKKMRFIIKTENDVYNICPRGYYEPSTKSRNTKKILESIKKFYERMK